MSRPQSSARRAAWGVVDLVVCFVAALSMAGYLGRIGWLFELASHFRVQYGALLALGAFGYLAGKRWRAGLAAGLLAAANLCLIVPVGSPPPLAAGRHSIRLAEANVYANNRDYSRTIEFVQAARPDIFLAIEVSFAWADALKALEAEFPFRRVIPANQAFGIAVYSRLPLVEVKDMTLGPHDGYSLAIKVKFLLDGEPVTLLCAHPYSPSSAEHCADRNRQLADLADLARRERPPLVVMGDLNTSPWSPIFQDFLSATRLVDSRRAFGIQATWPASFGPLRIPIDHCLVSPDIAVHQRMVGPDVGSDHLPIVVDLSLAAPTAAE